MKKKARVPKGFKNMLDSHMVAQHRVRGPCDHVKLNYGKDSFTYSFADQNLDISRHGSRNLNSVGENTGF